MESCCPANESSFPHLASTMRLRSTPQSCPPPSFRDSITAPTPHEMGIVSGPTHSNGHRRRCSSIPRPTSKLTSVQTTPPSAADMTAGCSNTGGVDASQIIVKPRTYSRTKTQSFVPNQTNPPVSWKTAHRHPPRLSLPATTSQSAGCSSDDHGSRQQLPVCRYSRHSLASLDSVISSASRIEETTTTPVLPLECRRTESDGSLPVTKITSPVSPHRRLMRPLGPPVPRSQTMGDLTCFVGAVPNKPSLLKIANSTIRTVNQISEIDVMDGLARSRRANNETEYFEQPTKQLLTNRRWLTGWNRATRTSSETNDKTPSRPPISFTDSNGSPIEALSRYSGVIVGDSSKKPSWQEVKPKTMPKLCTPLSPLDLTPDSGDTFRSDRDEGLNINVRNVSPPQ